MNPNKLNSGVRKSKKSLLATIGPGILVAATGDWVGQHYRNGWVASFVLVITLAIFSYVGYSQILAKLKILGIL